MTNTVDPGFNIDDVHRDVLGELFDESGLGGSAEERQAIAERWHQLDAWPDFAAAQRRLRRLHICVSFTILSLSLIVDVSRRNDHPSINLPNLFRRVLSIGVVRGLLRENRAVVGVIATDIAEFERLHSRPHREVSDRFHVRWEVRHETEKCVARPWG